MDPLARDYPWYTPYQFAGNKPIQFIDLDGAEEFARQYGAAVKKEALLSHTRIKEDPLAVASREYWKQYWRQEFLVKDADGYGVVYNRRELEDRHQLYEAQVGANIRQGLFAAGGYLLSGEEATFPAAALDQLAGAIAAVPSLRGTVSSNMGKVLDPAILQEESEVRVVQNRSLASRPEKRLITMLEQIQAITYQNILVFKLGRRLLPLRRVQVY